MKHNLRLHRWFTLSIVGLVLAAAQRADAACNLIPGTELTFDSALGATNRPFAGPGEPLEIRVRPCDTASIEPAGFADPASSYVVTLVFQAKLVPDRAVILSTDCDFFDLNPPVKTACETQLGIGGSAICLPVASPQDLEVVTRTEGKRLSVRFPDTDTLIGAADDDRTLAGPTSIAVTKVGDSLPCQIATQPCRTQTGLVACIDDFFANDGTCQTRVPATTFANFTALPVPNDFGHCFATIPPCNPQSPDEFRLTTDKAGNVLAPIDWRDVLVQQNLVPVPRLLRATIGPPWVPIVIPGTSFVTSHTPEGGLLPPIFEPQFDASAPSGVATLFGSADAPYTVLRLARRSETFQECNGGANDGLPCNEAADCPGACSGPPNAGARCTDADDCTPSACGTAGTCGPTVCNAASTNPGAPCNSDRNCHGSGAECGPALLDITPLANSGIGPVISTRFGLGGICQEDTTETCTLLDPCSSGPCTEYTLEAQNPVPLEGLEQSSGVSAFSVDEGLDGVIRNGDGDTDDTVITLQDRDTGMRQPLGAPAGCAGISGTPEGRAIVRVHQPPFSFPAVATEGNVVAFLESENDTALCDANGDDDSNDTILRVFRNEAAGASDATAGLSPAVAVDPDLKINHRSLVVSNGRVFFRSGEDAGAPRATARVSVTDGGAEANGYSTWPTVSADGRYVAFQTQASNLTAGTDDNNVCAADGGEGGGIGNCLDVYMRDRWMNTTERISVGPSGQQGNELSFRPAISLDGSSVFFEARASNWFAPSYEARLVERDRIGNSTVAHSIGFTVSATEDKRLLAFIHFVGLLPNDDNFPHYDVYLYDTQTTSLTLGSLGADGLTAANGNSTAPSLSPDGRYLAFFSEANDVVNPPTFTQYLYLRDLTTATTRNIALNGVPGTFSRDSRYLAFHSGYPALIPDDTNGNIVDVFVYNVETGSIDLVSVSSGGDVSDGDSVGGRLSADGRYVVFTSSATNLVPNDTNGVDDVFVHDRLTRSTVRVSVATDEAQANGTSGTGAPTGLSLDGREFMFASAATNLIGAGNDTNSVSDIFVRQADPAFLSANDRSGDGNLDDIILEVLDAATETRTSLCPSTETQVIAGTAAFLRPEGAGPAPDLETPASGVAGCPVGAPVSDGISLNGDSDPDDDVVHFWPGSGVVDNLDLAATDLAMAGRCDGGANQGQACSISEECPEASCVPTWLAALVSEAGQNQTDLNEDQDEEDDVLHVYNIGTASWVNVGQAADEILAIGNVVAFLTPESSQGGDLNRDGDTGDRVVQIYDATAARLTNLRRAAEEIVVGRDTDPCTRGPLVAFRTSEAAQDNVSLNGDNDADDDVLHLWSAGSGLINTGQSVIPCRLEACDPRHPYRVLGSRVKFLTFECDQGGVVTAGCAAGGTDLNGDGDAGDLILQQFESCTRQLVVLGEVDEDSGSSGDPMAPPDQGSGDVFVTSAGRCYQGLTQLLVPASCLDDDECPDGATCEDEPVVATNAEVSAHDVVLLPRKALTVKLRSGNVSTNAVLKVKLRNADLTGLPSRLRLTATDGTCPIGTVTGLPDLDSRTDGVQDTVLVAPRKMAKAVVPLMISAAAFTTHNGIAPARCTLELEASVATPENGDPTPRNNVLAVDINVIDGNDTASMSTHESVLTSAKPVKLKIGNDPTTTKTIKVQIANADLGEADHDVLLSGNDGDCPPGTVAAITPVTTTVLGGGKAKVGVTLTVSTANFTSPSKYAPARCTAQLTATTDELANVEPDASNNTTPLVIDVVDGHDF